MDGHRPFRFGVMGNASPEAWADHARRAEELGYDTLSLGEHIFASLAPLSALAAAAMCTSSIRLGSLTFANDFRNPVLLAKEVATLDALSGGRFELGLGSGFARADYTQAGIPFDPPGTRLDRLFDAVHLIKAAFDDDPVDYTGTHYTAAGLSLTPKLPRRPPILIGGGGRRVLQFAAREADIVSINLKATPDGGIDWSSISPGATAQKLTWIRDAAQDRFPSLELHWIIMRVVITDDPGTAAEGFIDSFRAFGAADVITVDDVLASPHVLIGTQEAIVERIQRHREEYGVSYLTVFSSAMEAFAPIVARLSGT